MTGATNFEGLAVLLGAGPGAEGLLTREGETWLSRCDCVIYDRLANPALLDLAPEQAEKIDVGKSPDHHTVPQEQINRLLVEKVREGKIVVRLKGGDPLIFGRGGEEIEALHEAGLEFRVVPGITAAIAAGAYAGVSLTDRRCASSVAFVTGHEDPDKTESAVNYEALAGVDTVVFYMGVGRLDAICRSLILAGKSPDTPAVAVQSATLPRQRTIRATLGTLAEQAREQSLAPPAVVIVGQVARTAEQWNWFERLPLAGQCVLVTRSRKQASRLARGLALHGAEVIEAPTIEIQPPETYTAVDAAIREIAQFDWLVLTSPNGVEAFLTRLAALKLDARALAGVQIAALGDATADALRRGGLLPDRVPETFTTEALGWALLERDVKGKRILLARSDIAPPDLAQMLAAGGAHVEDVSVYRTTRPASLPAAAREALQAGRVDWITFTSSSTVENFLALAGEQACRHPGCKIAAIGPVTARTLRQAGVEPTVVADPHTIEALITAVTTEESRENP
ncbi:MAG: uroporphyrinogen-III C-methyltransferase [Phycisphaerae bacterium]|nr:uroporphyrinogen-III C-methyltransferase [Phycisphaerae bacterium]